VLAGLAPVTSSWGLTQTRKTDFVGPCRAGCGVAGSGNNFAKALIAVVLADPKTGRQSLILLLGLTARDCCRCSGSRGRWRNTDSPGTAFPHHQFPAGNPSCVQDKQVESHPSWEIF